MMNELSTYEAARAFNVNPVTLQRLAATGKLDVRKDANGHWRFSKVSLEKWKCMRARKRSADRGRRRQLQHTEVGV